MYVGVYTRITRVYIRMYIRRGGGGGGETALPDRKAMSDSSRANRRRMENEKERGREDAQFLSEYIEIHVAFARNVS